MHVELRWAKVSNKGSGLTAAKLLVGPDEGVLATVASIVCTPEAMQALDLLLSSGARREGGIVGTRAVTYRGREADEHELELGF